MFALLVVLIAIVALFIILIVLLQSGKGGGLAAEFGGASSSTDSIMGGRQAANVLTRASWISGGVFMALALMLAIIASRSTTAPDSILRTEFQAPTATPAPVLDGDAPSPVDLEGGASGDEAPAEDGEPASE